MRRLAAFGLRHYLRLLLWTAPRSHLQNAPSRPRASKNSRRPSNSSAPPSPGPTRAPGPRPRMPSAGPRPKPRATKARCAANAATSPWCATAPASNATRAGQRRGVREQVTRRLPGATQHGMSISATSVRFDEHTMWVDLTDGRTIGVPLAWFPRLLNAAPAERQKVELSRISRLRSRGALQLNPENL